MFEIRKLLVPVDFSPCSRAAVDLAVSLAAKYEAKVDLLHVAELPYWNPEPRVQAAGQDLSVQDYALKNARTGLDQFVASLPADTRNRVEAQALAGRPRDLILERARQGGYDLLVMGTHGRIGRAHELAGSVAESIVRAAPCPVLTVREHE